MKKAVDPIKEACDLVIKRAKKRLLDRERDRREMELIKCAKQNVHHYMAVLSLSAFT